MESAVKRNDKAVTGDLFFKLEIPTVGRFEFLLARFFGKKFVAQDSGCEVTVHYWRGKKYITGVDFKKLESYCPKLTGESDE